MDPEFQRRLANLIAAAPPDIRAGLGIWSGHRDQAHQDRLFAAAVKKYGSEQAARKWVAKKSEHTAGFAADMSYNGNSLAKAPKNVVKWLHDNAGNYGLRFPLANENWHIEPVEARASGKPQYNLKLAAYPGLQDISGGPIPIPPANIPTAPQPMVRPASLSIPSRTPNNALDATQMFANGTRPSQDQVSAWYQDMPGIRPPAPPTPGLQRMPQEASYGVALPHGTRAPAMSPGESYPGVASNGYVQKDILSDYPQMIGLRGTVDPIGLGPSRNGLSAFAGATPAPPGAAAIVHNPAIRNGALYTTAMTGWNGPLGQNITVPPLPSPPPRVPASQPTGSAFTGGWGSTAPVFNPMVRSVPPKTDFQLIGSPGWNEFDKRTQVASLAPVAPPNPFAGVTASAGGGLVPPIPMPLPSFMRPQYMPTPAPRVALAPQPRNRPMFAVSAPQQQRVALVAPVPVRTPNSVAVLGANDPDRYAQQVFGNPNGGAFGGSLAGF